MSVALEAFKGMNHTEVPYVMDIAWDGDIDKVFDNPTTIELPVKARHIRDRIEKVDLMEDKQVHATSTEPPYTLHWTNPESGLHKIFAQATATDGETASTDVVEVEVKKDMTDIIAVTTPNGVQLKTSKNKVTVESDSPLYYIRIYSLNGMLQAEKKVNGSHRATLTVSASQGTLLLVQVETEAGTQTMHIRM